MTTKKSKESEPKAPRKKKRVATFSELMDAIKTAEASSLLGKSGQVWFDDASGEIWTTEFSTMDRYLKHKKSEKYRILWESRAKSIESIFDRSVPDKMSEEFSNRIKAYLGGQLPGRFNPKEIAESILEKFKL